MEHLEKGAWSFYLTHCLDIPNTCAKLTKSPAILSRDTLLSWKLGRSSFVRHVVMVIMTNTSVKLYRKPLIHEVMVRTQIALTHKHMDRLTSLIKSGCIDKNIIFF